jgi:hypothetical protein
LNEPISAFIQHFIQATSKGTFLKCTLSRTGQSIAPNLKNLYLRPVEIKKQQKIAFTYRYTTKDEVKNHSTEEAVALLETLLGTSFLNADLFTNEQDFTLSFDKKGTPNLQIKPPSNTAAATTQHDRNKNRLLDPKAPWLHLLGITSAKGEVHAHAQDKWRQINKFLEIIGSLLRDKALPKDAEIADMGSGKGYLTFALYDFLCHAMEMQPTVTGIELRPNLVDFCNETAQKAGFTGLKFVAQDINFYNPTRLDMLIALHACDTATDLALSKGILHTADIVVVAPCCHKQIRKAMHTQNALSAILHNGILEERQAEIVTDGIRALLLTSKGYQTKVFEFVSSEHTAKNIMITATKGSKHSAKREQEALDQVAALKTEFGIKQHFLEGLL